jgi:hypothetical protein
MALDPRLLPAQPVEHTRLFGVAMENLGPLVV